MSSADDSLAILTRFVENYTDAVTTAMDALTDETTPAEARKSLAAVLNYVLDLLDIFPDHYQGLGVADDALLLRLGARQAVTAGAKQSGLRELAAEADDVEKVLGELTAPLEKYLDKLGERTVR